MRGLVWIVALAACAKQGGVQISVTKNSTATTTVRIFVGAGAPSTDTTITAAGGVSHTGTSWSRDPTAGDDTAKMTGERVNWVYEPTGGPTRLPIVIAVGFDASGAVVGAGTLEAVDVPDSGFLTYDIPLVAPTNLSVWDSDPTASPLVDKCVALGPKGKEQMIVSPDDEDCDGFLDGSVKPGMWECEPLVYQAASRPAIPDEFTCFDRSATTTAQCFAGGPTCADGAGPSSTGATCPLSKYCAPGPLCLQCTAIDCMPGTTSQIPHYACPIALEMSGGVAKVCNDKLLLPPGAGADCTNVRLRSAQQNFLPTLSVDTDTRSIKLAAQLDKCKVTIEPQGKAGTNAMGAPDTAPVVALMAIDSVTTPFSGFVAPIVFTFGDPSEGCTGSPVTCTGIGVGATDRTALCTAVQ